MNDLIDVPPLFYTLPPNPIPYPYILINANYPVTGLCYLRRHHKYVKKVIIDTGIEMFRDPSVKEYPDGWVHHLISLYDRVRLLYPNIDVLVTAPDYCDDYNPRGLWLTEDITNIERTVDRAIECLEEYSDVNWLLSIQAWYRQPKSVLKCLRLYKELGVLRRHKAFAIGNLCVERSKRLTHEAIQLARKELGHDKTLHVFGLDLSTFPTVKNLIDSFDSFAWTRCVDRRLGFNRSARNTAEKIQFFKIWVEKLNLYKAIK